MENEQIVHLFDHRSILDNAVEQITARLQHSDEALRAGPVYGPERNRTLCEIDSLAKQLILWVAEAQTVSELRLAKDHDDVPSEPSDDPDMLMKDPERLRAVFSLNCLVIQAKDILEELKRIRDTPGPLFALYSSGTLKYFGPDEKGEPDLHSSIEYDLINGQPEPGWEHIDAECASLTEQITAVWAQFRQIRDDQVIPRHRAETKILREIKP